MPDDHEHAEDDATTTPPPPGPADHGGHGGMATREQAPELASGDAPKD